ncbi:MAG: DoxX family protein [Dehalococcoidales bacterium]|nr:DoxX family protein [Dehalococcoidales bacterium]
MVKMAYKVRNILGNKYTLLAVRLVLGSILIAAASGKLPDQARFVEIVDSYGLLPSIIAGIYGWSLPWVELILGVGLITGFFVRVFAGICILMIISFLIANGTAVYEKIFCPCFGGETGLIKTSDALVMDAFMILMALIIALFGSGTISLKHLIFRQRKSSCQP